MVVSVANRRSVFRCGARSLAESCTQSVQPRRNAETHMRRRGALHSTAWHNTHGQQVGVAELLGYSMRWDWEVA